MGNGGAGRLSASPYQACAPVGGAPYARADVLQRDSVARQGWEWMHMVNFLSYLWS